MYKKIIFILISIVAPTIFAASFSSMHISMLQNSLSESFVKSPAIDASIVNYLKQPDFNERDEIPNRQLIIDLASNERISTNHIKELTLVQADFLEDSFLRNLFWTAYIDEEHKITGHKVIDTYLLSAVQEKHRWLLVDGKIRSSLQLKHISIEQILDYDLTPLAIELLYDPRTQNLFLNDDDTINFNLLAQLCYVKVEAADRRELLKQLLQHRYLTVEQLIEMPAVALNFLVNPATYELCIKPNQAIDFELLSGLNYFVMPEISDKESFENLLRILMAMVAQKATQIEQIASLSNLQVNILANMLSLHTSYINPVVNFKALQKIGDYSWRIFANQAIKDLLRDLVITPKQAIALSPAQVKKIEALASTPLQTLEDLLKQRKITQKHINKYQRGSQVNLLTDKLLQQLFFKPDGNIDFMLLDSNSVETIASLVLNEKIKFLLFLGNVTFEQLTSGGNYFSSCQNRIYLLTDPLTRDAFIDDQGKARAELLQNIKLDESHQSINLLLFHEQISIEELVGMECNELAFLNYLIKISGAKYLPVKADGMLDLKLFKAVPNDSFLKNINLYSFGYELEVLGKIIIAMLEGGQLTIQQITTLSKKQLQALSYSEAKDLFHTASGKLDLEKLQHNPCHSIAMLEAIPDRIKRFMDEGKLSAEQLIALTPDQASVLGNEAYRKLFIKSDGAIDFELLSTIPSLRRMRCAAFKRAFIISLLQERKTSFEQLDRLNVLQLQALSNKQLANKLFISKENGRDFIDVAAIERIQTLVQLNTLKTLNQNGLLSGRDEERDPLRFDFTQALELSDDFLARVPNYIADVQNHNLTSADCVAIARELREEFRVRHELVNNDATRETTMRAEAHTLTSYVLKKLKAVYDQSDDFNRDFQQIREYFTLITKQEEANKFSRVLVLEGAANIAEKILPGTIAVQETIVNGVPSLKAYWWGYHGYKTTLDLYDNYIEINDKLHIVNVMRKLRQFKPGIITDDSVLANDLVVIFNISKKQHIAAANRCFNRLIGHECAESMVYVWRAIHDEKRLLGSAEEAVWQFAQGLCEIQRAHNERGDSCDEGAFEFQDNLLTLPDHVSCPTGTHNKLIEKLMRIHTITADVSVGSPAELRNNATNKFFANTLKKINTYLITRVKSIKSLKEKEQFMQTMQLIEAIDNDSKVYDQEFKNRRETPEIIEINAIINQVLEDIFSEYGALAYMNNRSNSHFVELATADCIGRIFSGISIDEINAYFE